MKITNTQTEAVILKELGRRLEAERLQRNLPQAELAAAAGLSRRTIIRMEEGGVCRLDAFVAVLKQFGIADRLGVVLSEPGLTPIQEARLERARAGSRGRVRARRKASAAAESAVRRWGDGVPVGKGGAR